MSVGQKQARTYLDRSVVEEHRVWRGKGPARAEATKTKAYRCSRLAVRCSWGCWRPFSKFFFRKEYFEMIFFLGEDHGNSL